MNIAEFADDVAEFTELAIEDGPRGNAIVNFADEYNASMSIDDNTVTVAFRQGYGIHGEVRFSHEGPAQAFLVAAHLDSLAALVDVINN